MSTLKFVTTVASLAICGLGIVGIVAPATLLDLGRALIAPPALYWVAFVRVVFGALLILVAPGSRVPRTLRVIGAFIVIAGLLTPVFGAARFGELFAWFARQPPLLVRSVAVLPVIAGLLLVYAINSPRRAVA
jgi:uncharacterized membrane protein YidH (DUF202 family)